MKSLRYLSIAFCLLIELATSQVFYDTVSVRSVGPGMMHYHVVAPAIPWNIHVLTVDARNPYIRFETVKANDRLVGLEGMSSMASRKSTPGHDAVGAVNGDFYVLGVGTPTNIQIAQGEILLRPISRPAFGFDENKSPIIDVVSLAVALTLADTVATVHGVNATRDTDQLILYNSYYGTTTGTNDFGTEALIRPVTPWSANDTVVCVVDSLLTNAGNMEIPKGKAVLSGHGLSAENVMSRLQTGDTVKLFQGISPGPPKLKELIGGNPKLVVNGIDVSPAAPREPRTAAGFSADSSIIYLITVDGRQAGLSAGMTFVELAQFMLQIGVYQGVNLDGGGSTTMVIRDSIMNSPSDGGERIVSNGWLVISSAPSGSLSDVSINPKNPRVLRNSSKQFHALGMDEYGNPDTLEAGVARFSCDAEIGTIDSVTGLFTAGSSAAAGSVILRYNDWTDTARVVVKPISSVDITPEDLVTDTIRTIAFTAVSKDTDNLVLPIALNEYVWTVTNPTVGIISSSGVFKGGEEGTTGIVASLDGLSDTSWIRVEVGSGYSQLDSFESLDGLTASSVLVDSFAVSVVESVATAGTTSLRIDYAFTASGDVSYGYLDRTLTVYGVPDSVIIDARTDNHSHRIFYVIEDDNGEEFRLYSSALMNKVGISDVIKAPISPNQVITSGASLHFPITIKRIEIQLVYGRTAGMEYTGTLFLDNLRVSYPQKMPTSAGGIEPALPAEFRLYQNFPNPFNSSTRVRFSVPTRAEVDLRLYDVLGRERVLTTGVYAAGEHVVTIDAAGLTTGVYFLRAGNSPRAAIKLILLK